MIRRFYPEESLVIDSDPVLRASASPLQALVTEALRRVGADPTSEGLERTPARFEKAFFELTSGYRTTAADVVGEGIFSSEGSGPVAVREIELFSLCEHHLLPFWGHASIAYLPSTKILGLSKLARIVDVYARRLQVQERLTREVADSILNLVQARAVVVRIEAQHMCMMMRGVKKSGSTTRTEVGLGLESLDPETRDRLWKSIE